MIERILNVGCLLSLLSVVFTEVNFLAFAISHDIPMSQEMWQRSFSDGIILQSLIDPRFYAQYRNAGVIWARPEAQLGTRNIREANDLRTLHSKVTLIDVTQTFEHNRGIAIAGSYNCSNNAEQNNDENLLIFHSPQLANQYYQDFMGSMNRSTGKSIPPVPRIHTDEWYPVMDVINGNLFEIEIAEGFGYPVRFLGWMLREFMSDKIHLNITQVCCRFSLQSFRG